MCLIHDMYQSAITGERAYRAAVAPRGWSEGCSQKGAGVRAGVRAGGDLSALLERVAQVSTRPRYAFMLLTLIAEIAGPDGSAGPYVRLVPEQTGQTHGQGGALVSLRDWLCDALTPMGHRDPRRLALAERVRAELARAGKLPTDPQAAAEAIEAELRDRVRASGKTNLSRAVSELVGAGLLRRHYLGYAVDHHNRGAQRQAVYTLIGLSRTLIAGRSAATDSGADRGEGAAVSAPVQVQTVVPASDHQGSDHPRSRRQPPHLQPPHLQGQHLQGEFVFTA